jgi:TRAP-type C4-dicarboxylate transport system substrate-binding protein
MTTLRKSVFTAATSLALPGAAVAQTVLQINCSLPDGSFAHVFLQGYETRLEAATDGAIDLQIFMSNTLGSEEDVLQGLSLGPHHASLSGSTPWCASHRRA